MKSVVDYEVLSKLMKDGWSYPIKGAISSGKGLYCWEKHKVLEDGAKEFVGFVAEDNESAYPNDGVVGDYYYKRCFEEAKTVYMIVTEDGEEFAQLTTQEEVELTATANDIRLGTTAVTENGVITGEKDIPSYHTVQGVSFIGANTAFLMKFYDNKYDYTKLQAMTAPFNESLTKSVAVDRVVIEDSVYLPGSTEPISTVTKDDENKSINFGIMNGDSPSVIRYFTYREEG